MKKIMIYRNLPDVIKSALLLSEGWLVGGAVHSTMGGNRPKDYDIIVPSRELFQLVCRTLQMNPDTKVSINTYGGLKFKMKQLFLITDIVKQAEVKQDEMEIDIWCEELGHFLMTRTKGEGSAVYNLKRQILIEEV